jgi:hypothetical protein
MITLDTVKCAIPEQYLKAVDMQAFKENGIIRIIPVIGEKEITVKKNLPMGLHSTKIELFQEEIKKVIIEFSAKILKGDYKKLITKNTIEQIENNINQNDYIQFKPYSLLNSEVFRVDLVNDLILKDPIKGIQALSLLRGNKDFFVRTWGNNESVYFIRNAKTINETLKFYRKWPELNKSKNKALIKLFSQKDIEYFTKIIRTEQTISRPNQIRKRFFILDNLMSSVLLSESKPNYKLYQKIKGGISFMSDIQKAECLNDVLWIALIEICQYDINTIETVLKPFAGKNLYRQRKKYRSILEKLLFQKINESGFTPILQDIENQLSA